MTPGDELLFLALGGSGEIGMNVNLYGCRGKWLMVDLGLTFADPWYPGVDLVLPDLEFIEERQKDLVGIVLTHGHEDHIGAIPYLADELKVPLYATPFTAGLIREKLEAEGLTGQLKIKTIPRDGGIDLAPFNVRFVALSHSIPEGNGVLIDTPHGKIFHTGDWKIDEQPVLGTPTGDEAMQMIGDEGVRALVCDSTNVFQDKPSGSEQGVHDGLLKAVEEAEGRVLVTTFASNAARLETLGRIATETGRTLCVAGRSLDRIIRVAQSTGYLLDFPETVRFEDAMSIPRRQLMIIATGGQGEPRAALARIAAGQHQLKLTEGDTVVFSSKQIPGNEIAIGRIMSQLSDMGVTMVTERQAHVHVSGHPGRPELKQMYDWIRPDVLVPVHGEMRHMREQARLGLEHGIPHAVVQRNGDVIRLAPGDPERVDVVRTGRLILDGDVILPADGQTMNQRRKLGFQGMIAVALPIGADGALAGEVAVHALGVPVEADHDDFIADCADSAARAWESGISEEKAREKVRLAVRRCATTWTGKKPIVEVMLAGVD
ncbi:ribonuclease J [Sphingomicrobium nitratireducens]|uniref:ribonuclease J n=1 Tax=Sphingomicrobium nitratireducens TaxID=2964666 RepID=UPI00223F1EB4|nr:ribonuclease J [Sphingomicrobium nitratireducens]